MSKNNHGNSPVYKILSALLVASVFIGFVLLSIKMIGLKLDFSTLWQYRQRLLWGFMNTIALSAGSLALSLVLGFLSAFGQKSRFLPLSYFCKTYVQLIRGTPLLVQIYFFYYIIGTAWGVDNRYLAGILILSLFEGAYISEIIRGGLESIDRRNFEIARSVGFTRVKTFRLVTLPILLSRTLPSLAGQFASIIKDSSLLSVVAIIELTQTTQEISADNFRMFENYIFVGLLYFILTFSVSLFSKWLERRLRHEVRAA